MTLQWTTVRAITPKWGQLGTVVNGRPTKITLSTTTTHPTSTVLQASLASVKVRVRDSAGKRLGSNGMMGKFKSEIHCWLKNCCQETSWSPPQYFGRNCSMVWKDKRWRLSKPLVYNSIWENEHCRYSGDGPGLFCSFRTWKISGDEGKREIFWFLPEYFEGEHRAIWLTASSWRAPGLRCRTMTWNAPAGPSY